MKSIASGELTERYIIVLCTITLQLSCSYFRTHSVVVYIFLFCFQPNMDAECFHMHALMINVRK